MLGKECMGYLHLATYIHACRPKCGKLSKFLSNFCICKRDCRVDYSRPWHSFCNLHVAYMHLDAVTNMRQNVSAIVAGKVFEMRPGITPRRSDSSFLTTEISTVRLEGVHTPIAVLENHLPLVV